MLHRINQHAASIRFAPWWRNCKLIKFNSIPNYVIKLNESIIFKKKMFVNIFCHRHILKFIFPGQKRRSNHSAFCHQWARSPTCSVINLNDWSWTRVCTNVSVWWFYVFVVRRTKFSWPSTRRATQEVN